MSESALAPVNAGYTAFMLSRRLAPSSAFEKSTVKLDTTTSLADTPAISATTISHISSPQGLRIGAMNFATDAAKDSEGSSTNPLLPTLSTNQTIMEAIKIVVPAFVR